MKDKQKIDAVVRQLRSMREGIGENNAINYQAILSDCISALNRLDLMEDARLDAYNDDIEWFDDYDYL